MHLSPSPRLSAFAAKSFSHRYKYAAGWAFNFHPSTAIFTKFHAFPVFRLTFWAFHIDPQEHLIQLFKKTVNFLKFAFGAFSFHGASLCFEVRIRGVSYNGNAKSGISSGQLLEKCESGQVQKEM